ncbi:MarR family winged helix-turn-helix transcriptional regulator [Acuticoccus sp. I52.16.1]|uniref:MarR family winged helix-turn-helix transcriptional regulator n=1 Tax=Acuticoccus sp. I52.16.1 TaxID=2928472 RepID=UPI001FD240E1|nr:MarR family transcriptional regulator [Acuticoccus sp. I52.16.1]UOM33180.1 MarR family transcriptional regulator [Acuticoccus sp. I52.16.1]
MPDNRLGLELDNQLCFALYAATNAVTRMYRPLLAKVGMTYPQYLVMLVLWQDGARPIGKIAERLRLGPSAVVPLVDQLQRNGFVQRRKDDNDRRMVYIDLTEQGAEVERQVAAAREMVTCRLGLDDAEIASLRAELTDLTSRLTAIDAETA